MSTWWRKISELDEDQAKVIALPKNGDLLVLGPAGCGKTNLLLLRAAFLAKAGVHDIMVLAFGRVLKEFLVAGTSNYEIDHNRIQTYLRWGAQLLEANGVPFDDNGDFAEVRANLLVRLRELAKLGIKSNLSDCILLDEAQDYSAEEIQVIGAFAKQLYAVGDSRQRVTKAVGGLEALRERCGEPIHLKHHYRNGIKICRVADGIRNEIDSEDGMEATSKYDEDKLESSVDAHPGLDIAAQCELVVEEVATQLFAYPDETIGILCPRQEDATAVAAILKVSGIGEHVQAQSYAEGYRAFDPSRRVVVSTIASAKGLEFRAVHILCMEGVSKFATQKNIAYTGVTRAKTSLRVYHNAPIPGYLERGLAAAIGVPDVDPSLDALFSKA